MVVGWEEEAVVEEAGEGCERFHTCVSGVHSPGPCRWPCTAAAHLGDGGRGGDGGLGGAGGGESGGFGGQGGLQSGHTAGK